MLQEGRRKNKVDQLSFQLSINDKKWLLHYLLVALVFFTNLEATIKNVATKQ